jgi:hypothetical protein
VIDMLDAQRALGGLTRDDLALLADDKPDPNKRKQRARAWERATDALRERDLIPPRKRRPVRAAPPLKPKPTRDLPAAVEVAL